MGKLSRHLVYLSGPMDEAEDGGMGWRKAVEPRLRSMGIGILNPANKPCNGYIEDFELRRNMKSLGEEGKFNEKQALMKPIVGIDLRMTHKADFLILYIDKEVFMFGSTVEFTWAVQQRKPVLIVCKQGKKNVSGFAWGMVPHEMMFNDFEEMFSYLEKVNDGEVDDMRRWCFFDYDRIYLD